MNLLNTSAFINSCLHSVRESDIPTYDFSLALNRNKLVKSVTVGNATFRDKFFDIIELSDENRKLSTRHVVTVIPTIHGSIVTASYHGSSEINVGLIKIPAENTTRYMSNSECTAMLLGASMTGILFKLLVSYLFH